MTDSVGCSPRPLGEGKEGTGQQNSIAKCKRITLIYGEIPLHPNKQTYPLNSIPTSPGYIYDSSSFTWVLYFLTKPHSVLISIFQSMALQKMHCCSSHSHLLVTSLKHQYSKDHKDQASHPHSEEILHNVMILWLWGCLWFGHVLWCSDIPNRSWDYDPHGDTGLW